MAIIKGCKVYKATSYELYEVVDGGYEFLASASENKFDTDALNLADGEHKFVVKAKANGFTDSAYSNEVVVNVGAGGGGYTLTIDQNGGYDNIKVYINGVEQSVSYGTWTDVKTVGVEDINGDGEMLIDESGNVWLQSVHNEIVTVTMTEDVHIVDIYH